MKKITSLMFMVMLCCIGAYAQVATEYVGKLVKVGTAVNAMEPNTWYFVHTPRNPNSNADAHVMPGAQAPNAGGLVSDEGEAGAKVTTTNTLTIMCQDAGVNANDYMKNLVRFVPADEEGAYYVQYGTGNYMAKRPGDASVNSTQQLAGLAGKYNFYLIKIGETPNEAGRFGWNVYNMADHVDNNGAGNNLALWEKGERKATEEESTPADGSNIKSNNVWQLYSIETLGEVDPYEAEVNSLVQTYVDITAREEGMYIDNLTAGTNVGNSYGNYRPEDVEAFLKLHTTVEGVVGAVDGGLGMDAVKEYFATLEDLKKGHEDYKAADKKVRENKIPLTVNNIQNGYYTLDNILNWTETRNDTVRYNQEECDQYNTENGLNAGEEGYLTTDSVKEVTAVEVQVLKGLSSKNNNQGKPFLAWGNKEQSGAFLWKVEKLAGSDNKYRIINMYQKLTFNSVKGGENSPLVEDDTVTVYFDFRGEKNAPVLNETKTVYSIRTTYGTAESGKTCYVHCGGHNGGKGKEGWVVGWYGDTEASQWYLTPVDEKTAEEWMSSNADKLNKMLAEADKIIKSAPGQLTIAKDVKMTLNESDSIITEASQIKANSTTLDGRENISKEDTYGYLLDGNPDTYWHSEWEGGNKNKHEHYLQISASAPLDGDCYTVKITRRAGADDDHVTKLAVRGYDEDNESLTFDQGEDLGVLTIPFSAKGKVDVANSSFAGKGKQIIRFYWEASNGSVQRGYWHASGFNVFSATKGTIYQTSQYDVRKAQAQALEAAIAKWTEAKYNGSNPDLFDNAQFQADYKALVDAYKAWSAVYVDPAALREAIKAAPAANIFVEGKNPGQWPAGAPTPTAVVEEAQKYDAACAYTPAESEKLIKDIEEATAQAFAAANKVKTGVWYRIKFPAEAMYDTYGWDKVGACDRVEEVSGETVGLALFGKTAAVGESVTTYVPFTNEEGEADTIATYTQQPSEEVAEGHGVFFFDDETVKTFTQGEDLFRFIQATDSSFMIQNKATGLFLHGAHGLNLSPVPTYFSTKAIGAGASLISFTTVLGEKPNNHVNLHGQRDDNRLVCWEAKNLGSNSTMLIEEAEAVTTEPATKYITKLWPGSVYTKVSPVDTKVLSGATAYGAEVVMDADTTIVLKAIEAEVIKAGTPYVIIPDLTGEYQAPGDRKNEIVADIIASTGSYGYNEKQEANQLFDNEYSRVEMEHGMAVDTIQKGLGHLVGTFRNMTIAAGKGLVPEKNGFAHAIVAKNLDAYRAYIKVDLDATTSDILSTLHIKVEGSIGTGIDSVISNVAKSGNIYTVDGKLVGKGNINTVNNLPAGIYILNGMKVIKK